MEIEDIQSVTRSENGGFVINGIFHVPSNEANAHFRLAGKWIAEGNTPDPFVAPGIDYREKRRRAYPGFGDQLDVIWKQFNRMRLNGENLIQEAGDILGSILATKAKHPKTGE
jgi:hypothetical protein